MKVKKCIIPVAGYGTRFLPATKALPKEMLPILDKPVVQYIVEEAVASGIEDIILVTGQNKRAVEDHFDFHSELEDYLAKTKKKDKLKQIRDIAKLANFIYIRQKGPYGNGTPILNAKHLIGDEPFAVMWGDELMFSKKPRLQQMMEVYEKYKNPVFSVVKTDSAGTRTYGIVEGRQIEKNVYKVDAFKEKPGPQKTKSRLASVGAYILTPDIFEELEKTPIRDGELWLVDAVDRLIKKRPLYASLSTGLRFDAGTKQGWLEANIVVGLADKNLRGPLRKFLKKNAGI